MALTPEQIKYYDDLNDMFATNGWKELVEEAKKQIYHLQADALEVENLHDLGVLKGRAFQLAYLIRLEEISDAQRLLLEEDTWEPVEDE